MVEPATTVQAMSSSRATQPVSPRFAVYVPIADDFADAAAQGELAQLAEASGWDGFFIMDHLIRRPPWKAMIDPWIALAVIAAATDRVLIGPMVTPLARRRTAVLARQTATLDQLAKGRLILGVGLGAPADEFTRFGEDATPKHLAEILDESLDVLQQLWSGQAVNFAGKHETADDVLFQPRPYNGHVPLWAAGGWPSKAPFRRAARLDGVWPIAKSRGPITVREFSDCVQAIREYREADGDDPTRPFDNCFMGSTDGASTAQTSDKVGRLTDAGMTWWMEFLDQPDMTLQKARERIEAGPPSK